MAKQLILIYYSSTATNALTSRRLKCYSRLSVLKSLSAAIETLLLCARQQQAAENMKSIDFFSFYSACGAYQTTLASSPTIIGDLCFHKYLLQQNVFSMPTAVVYRRTLCGFVCGASNEISSS